jgi:DNA invertase Pin-like site-specific DNA recombinase
MKKYGYIRVSTTDQNVERQLQSLLEKGIPEENIYIDKISGKSMDRPKYNELKQIAKSGDVIYFHELDRFARNFDEGKQEVDYYQSQNIQLIFLDMEFLNAFQETDDVILRAMGYGQVLMYLAIAHKEREKIRKRQEEGIKIAKKSGVKFGRKAIPKAQMDLAIKLWESGEYTTKQLEASTGVPKSSLYRELQKRGLKK